MWGWITVVVAVSGFVAAAPLLVLGLRLRRGA